jgi:hypothetical protein
VPTKDIAEIADKFTRNEILTANEIRQIIGIKPSDDPKADELANANMPQPADPNATKPQPDPSTNGNAPKPNVNSGV